MPPMTRRELLALLAGAAVTPPAARGETFCDATTVRWEDFEPLCRPLYTMDVANPKLLLTPSQARRILGRFDPQPVGRGMTSELFGGLKQIADQEGGIHDELALMRRRGRLMAKPNPPRFTEDDVERAADAWGANCGPVSVAAICELTLDEVYPHVGEFATKRYTNPTLMFAMLRSLGVKFEAGMLGYGAREMRLQAWPHYGLARVQWEGPWTKPGVPIKARYRKTHWVGCAYDDDTGERGIFDVNCMSNGDGWVRLHDWETILVPWLVPQVDPRADGRWHLTHAIEVDL